MATADHRADGRAQPNGCLQTLRLTWLGALVCSVVVGLNGCGGGGQRGALTDADSAAATQSVSLSDSATVRAEFVNPQNPTDRLAWIDFSGSKNAVISVTVARVTDAKVNAALAEQAPLLGVESADTPSSVSITLPEQPTTKPSSSTVPDDPLTTAGVLVTLPVRGGTPAIGQVYGMYAYVSSGPDTGAIQLLASYYSTLDGAHQVTALVPDWAFSQQGTQSAYTARVVVAKVNILSEDRVDTSYKINCPFPACLEAQRYYSSVLKGAAAPFRLSMIVQPNNATASSSEARVYLEQKKDENTEGQAIQSLAIGNVMRPGTWGGRTAFYVDHGVGRPKVGYLGLALDPSYYSARSGDVRGQAINSKTKLGEAGAAGLGLAVFGYDKICWLNSVEGRRCDWALKRLDPWDYMARSLVFPESLAAQLKVDAGKGGVVDAELNVTVYAKDGKGQSLFSSAASGRSVCYKIPLGLSKLASWKVGGSAVGQKKVSCSAFGQEMKIAVSPEVSLFKVSARYVTAAGAISSGNEGWGKTAGSVEARAQTSSVPDTGANSCLVLSGDGQDGCSADVVQDVGVALGSSYTKLDIRGRNLPDNAAVWTCVRDNVTGLVWEVKSADENSERSWKKWYANPVKDPAAVAGYVRFLNQLGLTGFCGLKDWRLPDLQELVGLVDYSRVLPAISGDYFPSFYSGDYWTNSKWIKASVPKIVSFKDGAVVSKGVSENRDGHVILVSGAGYDTSKPRFTLVANKQGLVKDEYSGLIWRAAPLKGDDSCVASFKSLAEVLECMKQMKEKSDDLKGWRIPTVKELLTLFSAVFSESGGDFRSKFPVDDGWYVSSTLDRTYSPEEVSANPTVLQNAWGVRLINSDVGIAPRGPGAAASDVPLNVLLVR